MLSYSTGLLNNFAPHITELTECVIPDMADFLQVSRTWIHSYILNSSFGASYDETFRQMALVYMRRTESAFQEYYSARSVLISYSTGKRENVSQYFESLHHFEQVISLIYQAYMLLRKFLHNHKIYTTGDGSELDRLEKLYNSIKHADGKLEGKKFPKKYSAHVWLTNTGISCLESTILYTELSDLLSDIANGAKRFGNPAAVLQEPTAPPGS
jgi:hypothetical protein